MQITDQTSFSFDLVAPPQRIVSLVPSQTELLFHLGLDNEVIGITKFCIHPNEKWKTTTRVGGTKDLNLERIADLEPDLVIANKEENTKAQIEWLRERFPVWTSDINSVEDAFSMIGSVSDLVGKSDNGKVLLEQIQSQWSAIKNGRSSRVLYLIWNEPIMAVGQQNYINAVLEWCGFTNVVEEDRYPSLTVEDIRKLDPQLILLSSEPFPFSEQHLEKWMQLFPQLDVRLIDGELFSWYGSRMKLFPEYFRRHFTVE